EQVHRDLPHQTQDGEGPTDPDRGGAELQRHLRGDQPDDQRDEDRAGRDGLIEQEPHDEDGGREKGAREQRLLHGTTSSTSTSLRFFAGGGTVAAESTASA